MADMAGMAHQAHWLVNKAGGSYSYTQLNVAQRGHCIIPLGRIRSVHRNKRHRYIWGNSWTSPRGFKQTVFWVTQNHGFLYQCVPYNRNAHINYAIDLAWLIAANTWYIYIDGERFAHQQPSPAYYLQIQRIVLRARPIEPIIQDHPEWQYPTRDTRRAILDEFPSVSPVASQSSVVSIPEGSDTRSVCSESDVRPRQRRRIRY